MTIITELFLPAVIIAIVIWWSHTTRKYRAHFKNIPGPPPVPLFGNFLDFTSTTELLDLLTRYTEKYGGVVKMHRGPWEIGLLVSDYKFLEYILSSTTLLTKSKDYKYLHPWLGTGLLTSDGLKWKQHRRILTPAFHFQILEQFISIFETGGNKLVKKLENEVNKKSVDIYPFVTLCTLDIICETAMGTTINAQDYEDSDYVRSVKHMCRILMERAFSLLQFTDTTYPLSKNYYTQKKALRILHNHTNDVINQRRQALENKNQQKEKDDPFSSKKKKVFLDSLLEATIDGRPLTQEEIREEVDTFMFEGHDTTASAISFTLYCLANHPEVQAKAFKEQQELYSDNKNPTPTYTELQSMKYLEQVIKETLRLYPSVPTYGRETTKTIEYEGTTIPVGTILNIFAYSIQRNPKYFPEPERFNPSRFDDIDGKLPYAYIPFSAGPRNCIGQKFAMLEIKSTVSKIIRKFELHPAFPKCEPLLAAEAVLKSANGIKISLKLRE